MTSCLKQEIKDSGSIPLSGLNAYSMDSHQYIVSPLSWNEDFITNNGDTTKRMNNHSELITADKKSSPSASSSLNCHNICNQKSLDTYCRKAHCRQISYQNSTPEKDMNQEPVSGSLIANACALRMESSAGAVDTRLMTVMDYSRMVSYDSGCECFESVSNSTTDHSLNPSPNPSTPQDSVTPSLEYPSYITAQKLENSVNLFGNNVSIWNSSSDMDILWQYYKELARFRINGSSLLFTSNNFMPEFIVVAVCFQNRVSSIFSIDHGAGIESISNAGNALNLHTIVNNDNDGFNFTSNLSHTTLPLATDFELICVIDTLESKGTRNYGEHLIVNISDISVESPPYVHVDEDHGVNSDSMDDISEDVVDGCRVVNRGTMDTLGFGLVDAAVPCEDDSIVFCYENSELKERPACAEDDSIVFCYENSGELNEKSACTEDDSIVFCYDDDDDDSDVDDNSDDDNDVDDDSNDDNDDDDDDESDNESVDSVIECDDTSTENLAIKDSGVISPSEISSDSANSSRTKPSADAVIKSSDKKMSGKSAKSSQAAKRVECPQKSSFFVCPEELSSSETDDDDEDDDNDNGKLTESLQIKNIGAAASKQTSAMAIEGSESESEINDDDDDDDWDCTDGATSFSIEEDELLASLCTPGLFIPPSPLCGPPASSPLTRSPTRAFDLQLRESGGVTRALQLEDDDDIVFTHDDDSNDEETEEERRQEEERVKRLVRVNERWRQMYPSESSDQGDGKGPHGDGEQTGDQGVEQPGFRGDERSVYFAVEEEFCPVLDDSDWLEAYREARIGPWKNMAADRLRFYRRIETVNESIGCVFSEEHRNKIYSERFSS